MKGSGEMAKLIQRTETRDVPALKIRAEVGAVDSENRTVEITWTTGARVLRGYYEQFYEELSLDPKHVRMQRLNNGAPFLADHNGSRVSETPGVVESATLEGKKGRAMVRFAKAEDDPEADKIFRKVKDKIIRNVSVGYRVHKMEKQEAGEGKIPVYRATDWEPFEISAVAMGADDGAGFRSSRTTETNPCIFTRGEPQEESNKMNEEEKAAAAEKAAQEKRDADLRAAATLAERERVAGIQHAVRVGKLGAEFATKLVDDGVTLDKARALVLEELATRSDALPPSPGAASGVEVVDDNRDKFVRGMSAWMFEKAGHKLIDEAKKRNLKGFEGVETNGGEFRGMSLMDIARLCAERSGHSTKGIFNKERLIQLALTPRSGYGSTSDFGVLFENVMYKSMRAAYATQNDTWRRFCGTDTVSDFRSANRFLNGSFGTLPVVAEGGEFKNLAIPDGAKQAISVQTYGAIIALSRQAMINDDMGALSDVAVRFGGTAGRTIENAVYALLAQNAGLGPVCDDGVVFFHATHNNISTGGALSVAALDTDKLKMRAQVDISSNDYLDLVPTILLIVPQLESAAKVLNESAFDHDSTKLQKPNSARGMFADIVTSQRLTAISSTRRYLFTAAKEAFKVVFLEGAGEGPTMETNEGWRVDGTEWKARIDFKAQPFDPKTAVTSAGT